MRMLRVREWDDAGRDITCLRGTGIILTRTGLSSLERAASFDRAQ
jgi:hypothetical protein